MEQSFKSRLDSASSVLILLPLRPYFDQVAAGLSLYLALKGEKEVTICCPSPMLVEVNRLVGVNQVVQEIGNKNLTLKFAGYPAKNIEKVSYDIENDEFKLMLVPKTGFSAPQKEQVNLTYSGISAGTVILIGGANESHFPSISTKDIAEAELIHVGTRQLFLAGKEILSFARPASSISELVAALIKQSGYLLDGDIATNLLMGIEEGSQHFSGTDVGAETFAIFAELLKSGGRRVIKEKPAQVASTSFSLTKEEPFLEKVEKKESPKEAPKDWLEPKIFKGTSVS